MNNKGDLGQEWGRRANNQWRRDFTDLNREMAGVQGNRIKRFTAAFGSAAMTSDDKDQREQDDWLVDSWLAQMDDRYRRSYAQLSQTIDDAQKAYLLVLEDIQLQKEEAALALEEVRANALVLEDGHRVYFTKDGSVLFDDDGHQIAEEETIAEARDAQERNPDASTHEENKTGKDNFRTAQQREEEVFEKLRELEELKTRMEQGALSQGDLTHKTQEIIAVMSPEVRELFDRIHGDTSTAAQQEIVNEGGLSSQHAFASAGRGEVGPKEEISVMKTNAPLELKS